MECPKYHAFYGFKPLESTEREWSYDERNRRQPLPRKKLNQHLRSFVLEEIEFDHVCAAGQKDQASGLEEEKDKAGDLASSPISAKGRGKGKKGQVAEEKPKNKRQSKAQEKEMAKKEASKEQQPKNLTLKYKDYISHLKTMKCYQLQINFKCPFNCQASQKN